MRVVIATGDQPHHKFLCAGLSRAHEVVGIIHPRGQTRSAWSKLTKRCRTHGFVHTILNAATRLPGAWSGWDARAEGRKLEGEFFAGSVSDYEKLANTIIHRDVDVHSKEAVELMGRLRPDIAVCLGGPVYPKAFIESVPLMLNFHSGISPIYNGSASAYFAFANGHPHLCGGTLMRINTVVDGGDVLGHYLPEVHEGDTPGTLFMKTVRGAALVYDRILSHFEEKGVSFASFPQPRPLFYYQGIDWTLYQTQRVRRNVRKKLPAKHARAERIIDYWKEKDEAAARNLYEKTLHELLWG
jgi:methionyl-tRNA formyltransferase